MSDTDDKEERDEKGRFVRGHTAYSPGNMKRAQKQFRALLHNALEDPDSKEDELIKSIVAGVKKGDSVTIRLATEYLYGKPKEDITVSFAEKALPELLGMVPEALKTLREAGLVDFAVAIKGELGSAIEGEVPRETLEDEAGDEIRLALPNKDLATG